MSITVMTASAYRDKANKIALEGQDRVNGAVNTTAARREITATVRELRAVKAEIVQTEREIRTQAADDRRSVSGSGQVVGLFASSKTRGAMARGRAAVNRGVANRRAEALRPYADLKPYVDGLILQFERFRDSV